MEEREVSFRDFVEKEFGSEIQTALEESICIMAYDTPTSSRWKKRNRIQLEKALEPKLMRIREISKIMFKNPHVLDAVIDNFLFSDGIAGELMVECTLFVHDATAETAPELGEQVFRVNFLLNIAEEDLKSNCLFHVQIDESPMLRRRNLTDTLIPFINTENLELRAKAFLQSYYPEMLKHPLRLNPHLLAERLHLNVLHQRIDKNMRVYGQIYFREIQARFYDETCDTERVLTVQPGTIIVDPTAAFMGNMGTYDSTIVHECVHWWAHRKAYLLEQLILGEDATAIRCRVDGVADEAQGAATQQMEWQANALTPLIQMPREAFKQKADEAIARVGAGLEGPALCDAMPQVINELAAFFGVSQTAAKLRLMEVGYPEAAGALIYVDGHYVPPHAWREGALAENETFTIPLKDAIRLSETDERLKGARRYLYLDGHFVLDHQRYVERNEAGRARMTDYARHHMEKCCLAFDISVQDEMAARYERECLANRGEGSPVMFQFSFKDKDLSEEEQFELLDKTLQEEARILAKLPNNCEGAWQEILQWRGIKQAEIVRRTGLSKDMVSRVIHNKTGMTMYSFVLMCQAVQLPYVISTYLLARSRVRDDMAEGDYARYLFVLQHMYATSVPEVKYALQRLGVKPPKSGQKKA